MRIALITAFNELYRPLAEISIPNFQAYCNRHGYDLKVGEYHDRAETQEDRVTRGDLCKAGMFRQLYNDYDVIMWLDVDSIIMNHDIRIQDKLRCVCAPPFPGCQPWLWTHNTDGPLSGFWIARTTPLIRKWVERFSFACAYEYGGGDQYAMEIISQRQPYRFIGDAEHCIPAKQAGHCFLPEMVPEELKQFGRYEPGDWIITFPSMDIATRLEYMKHYAGLVAK